jgi:hypothetical protein
LAVPLADYLQHARQRSPSWQTVTVSAKTFRQIAHPVDIYGKEKQ